MKEENNSQFSILNSPLIPPGYKQTEVGVIPEDWVCPSITEIAAKRPNAIVGGPFGSDLVSKDYVDTGVPVVRGQNMARQYVSGDFAFVSRSKGKQLQANLAHADDVLFTQRGTLGQVSIIPRGLFVEYLVSQSQMKLTLNSDVANCLYVYQYFVSPDGQRQILDSAIQTGVPHTNLGILRCYKIPLPPTKAEQEAIAEALSDADALIESLEQLLTKKRRLKQGAMQELLRPKDGWVEMRLGKTASLKARIGWQGLTTAEYLDSGDFYLVTGTEFKNGFIEWSECHYVTESRYKQDKNIQLKEHDVLVTKDGTIGKVALINHLDKPATLNSGVFVIRPIEEAFHPDFFYYLLCSNLFSKFLGQLSAGSTINHLYQKDFVNFVYETPMTIKEQTAIATILSDMDAEIAALETKLAKTRQLKQGMMQELLTGRIRLVETK
jgi:type I restriction enzyme, S subunit